MGTQAARHPGRNPGRNPAGKAGSGKAGSGKAGSGKAGSGKGARPQPITRHPLFPVLVALWFAALFGLGSLAVRIGLVEALVLRLRLDLILPFAAPPLGMKARVLIALAMATTGALAGLWLGRRLGQAGQPRPQGSASGGIADSLKRVIARDMPAPAARRRSLAVDDQRSQGWAGDIAPLPGDRPQVLSASDYDFIEPLPEHEADPVEGVYADRFDAPEVGAAEPAPLDLDGFLPAAEAPLAEAPQPRALAPDAAWAPVAPRPFDGPSPAPEPQAPAEPLFAGRPFAPPPAAAVQGPDLPLDVAPAMPAAEPEAAVPAEPARGQAEAGMTHLDLVNQLAEAMQARRERLAAVRARAEPEEPAPAMPSQVAMPSPVAGPEPVSATTASFEPVRFEPVIFEPVGEAAHALQENGPAPAAGPAASAPLPRLGDSPAAEAPAPLPQMPTALRPLSFHDHEDDADFDTSHAPPRSIGLSPVQADGMDAADDGNEPRDEAEAALEDALEDGYSSLLDLSRPVQPRASFIRIEDPDSEAAAPEPEPVVIFPGQAPRPFDGPPPA
ncbi:MAG TPA: hypothetical protein PKD92_03775, partial [Novosphingobium sp.]|nr:hypothetical protein [Novosphingobium sp.]